MPTPPEPNTLADVRTRRRRGSLTVSLTVGVAALALIAIAYRAMFANAPVWDDPYIVTNNPYVVDPRRLGDLLIHDLWTASAQQEPSSFYRPLTMLSYWLNVRIGGASLASFHTGNLLVHIGVAALVLLVARRTLITSTSWIAATVAASWFLLAPITSEGVLWLTGRFDPLGALFTCAALLCNLSDRPRRVAGTLAFAALALLAKESFACVPALLLVQDIVVCRRVSWRLAPKYAALGAVFAGYLLARRALGIVSLGVVSATGIVPLAQSFAWMVATFLGVALVPVRLDPFRRYAPVGAAGTLAAWVAIVTVTIIVVVRAFRRRERAPRLVAFGWLTFLIALAPASLTGPNLGIVGERYAYLPAAGLALTLAGVVESVRAAWPARLSQTRAVPLASVAWIVLLTLQALRIAQRVPDWRDERALFTASLRADPNGPEALLQLGQLEAEAGRLTEADALLSHADRERPGYWRTRTALCYLRLHQDRLRDAEATCLDAARLNPANPRAYVNLSAAYIRMRDWPRGLAAAQRALVVKPHYAEAHFEVGLCLANLGHLGDALAHTRAALDLDPQHPSARGLLEQLDARGVR